MGIGDGGMHGHKLKIEFMSILLLFRLGMGIIYLRGHVGEVQCHLAMMRRILNLDMDVIKKLCHVNVMISFSI